LLDNQIISQKLLLHFPEVNLSVNVSECQVIINYGSLKTAFWLDDWLHKNDIVLSIIASILGKNKTIFARNCQVKKVDKALAEAFLNENHLLGYLNAYHKYALFFDNEIRIFTDCPFGVYIVKSELNIIFKDNIKLSLLLSIDAIC
jgi:hypothetical protein